jgi:guanylate kinase
MRPGETDGVQYHFIAIEEFQRRIKAGDFLEWAQYANSFYGTLKSELSPLLDEGSHVLLEIDMQGARQIMDLVPKENLLTVFVDAGTWEDLSSRITARAPITNEELEKRHARYIAEMSFKDEANTIITNTDGGLEFAKKQFEEVVDEFFKAV